MKTVYFKLFNGEIDVITVCDKSRTLMWHISSETIFNSTSPNAGVSETIKVVRCFRSAAQLMYVAGVIPDCEQ